VAMVTAVEPWLGLATNWLKASTLALFGPLGRRGKLIEQALQALG